MCRISGLVGRRVSRVPCCRCQDVVVVVRRLSRAPLVGRVGTSGRGRLLRAPHARRHGHGFSVSPMPVPIAPPDADWPSCIARLRRACSRSASSWWSWLLQLALAFGHGRAYTARPSLAVVGLILARAGGGAAFELAPLLAQSPPAAAPSLLSLGLHDWLWSHRHGRHLTQVTVSTVAELTASVVDSTIDKIVVLAGRYEFSSEMCTQSALCIYRAVIIEAEVAGSVVLDGMGVQRVVTVESGGVAELVGLNITGGYAGVSCTGLQILRILVRPLMLSLPGSLVEDC